MEREMDDKVIPLREELSEFDKQLVEKSVRIEIPLRDATRVELREICGILARAAQEAVVLTHEEKNERRLRTEVWIRLRDAQLRIVEYKRKAKGRRRSDVESAARRLPGTSTNP